MKAVSTRKQKSKTPYFVLAIVVIVLAVYASLSLLSPKQGSQSAALANPASVKCEQDGGVDKIISEASGERGLCLFNDGSVCDEWAYFRGECSKGACARTCNYIGSRSEGWYDCNGSLLFYDKCANEDPATAGSC